MKTKPLTLAASLSAALTMLSLSVPAHAVDADAAQAVARQQNCLKCHSIDKKKDGPSFKEVSAKYKGKSDAEERLITHITSGEKAKFPDGHEEEHKVIKAKEPEVKNLVQWILSQ